ncbi:MAG TPA: SgcJ/EcaC family oxidoreductase [Candidatus Binatia bacterium]|nr:SgcJ/EcaC family oxidoreductase [Candidatus Binatia bacterium]
MSHTQLRLLRIAFLLALAALLTIVPAREDRQLLELYPLDTFPQEANAATRQAQSKDQSKQPAPEAIVKNLVVAWNQGDSDSIARLFLPDGVLVMPTGSVVRSRPEIQKTIVKERLGRLKETTLRNTVDDVSLVDANTAVVKGKYLIDGVKILGLKTSAEGSYIFRQIKQQGRWMIAKAEVHRKKSE